MWGLQGRRCALPATDAVSRIAQAVFPIDATRVKRLRDALGNQMVSALLVKTITRHSYVLAVGKDVIRAV